MSNAPRFDPALNDRGHATTCPCEDCMPVGSDGAMDDALDAAQAEMARSGIRGDYVARPLAKSTCVSFRGEGSRTDLDREALRTAGRHLAARGIQSNACHLNLYVFAAT